MLSLTTSEKTFASQTKPKTKCSFVVNETKSNEQYFLLIKVQITSGIFSEQAFFDLLYERPVFRDNRPLFHDKQKTETQKTGKWYPKIYVEKIFWRTDEVF